MSRPREIIDGTLVTHPRPASLHARASSRLGMDLGGPFDRGKGGPGGWVLLDEPELHPHGDVLVPDLAGWRRDRMPELPDAPAFELAPGWVCEVLSRSTAAVDRAEKLPIYAREHVAHAWLVDPIARTLEAFSLEERAGSSSGPGTTTRRCASTRSPRSSSSSPVSGRSRPAPAHPRITPSSSRKPIRRRSRSRWNVSAPVSSSVRSRVEALGA